MAEWSNAAVSKTVVPSGTGSSNLPLSARRQYNGMSAAVLIPLFHLQVQRQVQVQLQVQLKAEKQTL